MQIFSIKKQTSMWKDKIKSLNRAQKKLKMHRNIKVFNTEENFNISACVVHPKRNNL